jgi:glycosyltransferase involved in cell wall biosynthesis
MASIAVVSFRLGGLDGVSIEAAKWTAALRSLGHHVTTVAGSGEADHLLADLALDATGPVDRERLGEVLADVDLVIVENVASLPLNLAARDALNELRRGRPTLFHHHDLAEQQARWRHLPAPLDDPAWAHVVINQRSANDLAERGITADVMRNRFDCSPPAGARESTRAGLGVSDDVVVLMPSRALARKNVAGAVTLTRELGATLWLLGPPEDGFDAELDRLLAVGDVKVLRGSSPTISIHDAYAASDCVVVASNWEGFGNPVLESVTHRRVLALNHYPVARELLDFGFHFYELGEVARLRSAIERPDERERERNLDIARRYFNLDDLPAELDGVLTRHFALAKH